MRNSERRASVFLLWQRAERQGRNELLSCQPLQARNGRVEAGAVALNRVVFVSAGIIPNPVIAVSSHVQTLVHDSLLDGTMEKISFVVRTVCMGFGDELGDAATVLGAFYAEQVLRCLSGLGEAVSTLLPAPGRARRC